MEDIILVALAPFYAISVIATAHALVRLMASATEVKLTETVQAER